MIPHSGRLIASYAVQNAIGVAVFGGLLLTNALAVMLHRFPAEETLWALSIPLHRVFGKLLDWTVFGGGLNAWASLLLLLSFTLLPVVSYLRRSWLGTAVTGHIALGLCGILAWDAACRASPGARSASLSPLVEYGLRDASALLFMGLSVATLVLCILNHIVFFRRA